MNQNRKLAQLMFKDNFMFGAVMAVSYTHLDVYKRQVKGIFRAGFLIKEKGLIW